MSTNAKNVSVGKPMVGGAVFYAPVGTALPTNATDPLSDAYKDMGYISEDGVKNNGEREVEEIKAWGGNTVLTPQKSKKDTFGLTFIEALNPEVLKRVYSEDNVSGTIEEGMTIRVNSKELEYGVWVIDMVLTEGALKRIVIPNGKITETGEISYTDGEAIAYESTVTAYPGDDGDTHKEYIVRASSPAPDPDPEELGTLTVTSETGTDVGDTVITVSPAKEEGNVYKYKVADEAKDVTYDMNVQNWTAWDGEAEITAESDKVLTLVEATSDYKARKAGSVTVVANA